MTWLGMITRRIWGLEGSPSFLFLISIRCYRFPQIVAMKTPKKEVASALSPRYSFFLTSYPALIMVLIISSKLIVVDCILENLIALVYRVSRLDKFLG
jgi:hypothetical protein